MGQVGNRGQTASENAVIHVFGRIGGQNRGIPAKTDDVFMRRQAKIYH